MIGGRCIEAKAKARTVRGQGQGHDFGSSSSRTVLEDPIPGHHRTPNGNFPYLFLRSWSIHETASSLPCMAKPHHRAANRQNILTVLGGFRKASVSTHSYGIWWWLDRTQHELCCTQAGQQKQLVNKQEIIMFCEVQLHFELWPFHNNVLLTVLSTWVYCYSSIVY